MNPVVNEQSPCQKQSVKPGYLTAIDKSTTIVQLNFADPSLPTFKGTNSHLFDLTGNPLSPREKLSDMSLFDQEDGLATHVRFKGT